MHTIDEGLWGLFHNMDHLLEQVGHNLGASRRAAPFLSHSAPALNVWKNDNNTALVVTGEIPGVEPDSISISVLGDTLTVSGKRVFATDGSQHPENTKEFNRSIQLPFTIDAIKTEARCRNGVLTVVLRRPEAEMPRKIALSAA